ncbi:MAG: type I methionyl aminopeptidase [Bacilli bacterium]|jgi:methionyl aminopeptidase|nr:type I methionyl aminopeptidase [Bacilli bacterium]MCH4210898.1 type I methionyl aminopeptidase [Bacilli bacterium]MCH4228123.1 type I methionyl aminopeptidase [Bacilli bacterium]MCI2054571.1 type I methionyl aminopeptidase [Bacilli bacterium]
MIIIKSPREIELMRKAGRLLAHVYEVVGPLVQPGVSTKYLNDVCEKVIRDGGGVPAELGYGGYPAAVCASVNDVLVHGIPSEKKILTDGDIVSLDIVVTLNGYMADACRTYPVGITPESKLRLIKVTEECFYNGASHVKDGARLGDVSSAIEETAKANGYSVPLEYTGHGIGSEMHEDPYIPDYGTPGTGPILKEGMTLAIEPMVMAGKNKLRILKDGWTAVSKDGMPSAHYENTLVVTKDGYEILTK